MARKKKPKKVEHQAPVVLALILADAILFEPASGKHYINGTFTNIMSPAFPFMYPRIAIYLAMTNGHGQTPLKIRLVDAEEARPALVEVDLIITFPDPIVVVEAVGAMQNVVFPAPGDYRLELYVAGAPLVSRRLIVLPLQPPPQPEPPKGE